MLIEHYRTDKGSRVEVTGAHRGVVTIDFDRFGEDACFEAYPVADVGQPDDAMLTWSCACCPEGGSSRLLRCE